MAVFTVGARTPEGWDFLFERYRTSLQMSVKSRMKVAMAFSPLQDKLTRWARPATPPQASPMVLNTKFLLIKFHRSSRPRV